MGGRSASLVRIRAGRPEPWPMRICMLTTTHRPYDGRIFEKEAKSLAKEHDVTIIAPSDVGGAGENGDVRIVTIPKPASTLFHPVTLWRAFRACLSHKCDVIHCHEPDALLIALLLKAVSGRKVVYDIHEHWPSEIPFDLGLPNATALTRSLESVLSPLELGLARFADAKIAVSESVAERFRGNGKEPVIISNFSVADSVPLAPQVPQAGSGYSVMYMAGNMQLFHGIRECISAMSKVTAKFPDLSLTLVGNVREDIGAIAAKTDPRPEITLTGYSASSSFSPITTTPTSASRTSSSITCSAVSPSLRATSRRSAKWSARLGAGCSSTRPTRTRSRRRSFP